MTACAVLQAVVKASDYVDKGNTVNLCAIDLSKAFDKANHNALYIKMMKRFIPAPPARFNNKSIL